MCCPTYKVQRLTMQIVLRELFGANRGTIARLVGRAFLVLLGIGAAIGLSATSLLHFSTFHPRQPAKVLQSRSHCPEHECLTI